MRLDKNSDSASIFLSTTSKGERDFVFKSLLTDQGVVILLRLS